jgi:phosphoribosylpyrophosphate synthetase
VHTSRENSAMAKPSSRPLIGDLAGKQVLLHDDNIGHVAMRAC